MRRKSAFFIISLLCASCAVFEPYTLKTYSGPHLMVNEVSYLMIADQSWGMYYVSIDGKEYGEFGGGLSFR